MALRIKNYAIVKVGKATHHQGDVRYSTSRCTQYSFMSPMSVTWTLHKSSGMLDKSDLDCILGKGKQLFKSIGKFRYLGLDNLLQEFLVEKSTINVELL